MLLVAAVAVIVIGPQDLPRALYSAGKFVRKIKIFTGDIQKSFEGIMREGELDEITREANKAGGDNLQFEIDRQYEEEQKRKAALKAAEGKSSENKDEKSGTIH
jgi:sec-independent protein translocase protein TatB